MNKFAFVLSFLLVLPVSTAFADDISVAAKGDATVSAGDSGNGIISAQAGVKASDDEDTTEASSSVRDRGDDNRQSRGSDELTGTSSRSFSDENASSTDEDTQGASEEHKSAVAAFVKSLLSVADRDGGIGEEVRAVAESQSASASTTAEAMVRVEKRNPIKAFLLGTDWSSVGQLRSQLAKDGEDIARLQAAIASTTDAGVRAELTAQVTALSAEQAKVQAFVDAHANSFSLFGWFTRLFAKNSD